MWLFLSIFFFLSSSNLFSSEDPRVFILKEKVEGLKSTLEDCRKKSVEDSNFILNFISTEGLDLASDYGKNLLTLLIKLERFDVLQEMAENGVDFSLSWDGPTGNTTIWELVLKSPSREFRYQVTRWLLEKIGVDPNMASLRSYGKTLTPLDIILYQYPDDRETADLLRSFGARRTPPIKVDLDDGEDER